jgi:hypothetical protein
VTRIDCQRGASQIAYGWMAESRTDDVAAKSNPESADVAAAKSPAESADMAAAKPPVQSADMGAAKCPA